MVAGIRGMKKYPTIGVCGLEGARDRKVRAAAEKTNPVAGKDDRGLRRRPIEELLLQVRGYARSGGSGKFPGAAVRRIRTDQIEPNDVRAKAKILRGLLDELASKEGMTT